MMKKTALLLAVLTVTASVGQSCDPSNCFTQWFDEWDWGGSTMSFDWEWDWDWEDYWDYETTTETSSRAYLHVRSNAKKHAVERLLAMANKRSAVLPPSARYIGHDDCVESAENILDCMYRKSDACWEDPNSFQAMANAMKFSHHSRTLLVTWIDCLMDDASKNCVNHAMDSSDCQAEMSDFNFGDIQGSTCNMLRDHAQCLLDSITDDCGSDDANVVADIMDRSFDPAASLIECDLNLIVKEDVPISLIMGVSVVGVVLGGLAAFAYYCYRRGQNAQLQQQQAQPVQQVYPTAPQPQPINITNVTTAPAPVHYPQPYPHPPPGQAPLYAGPQPPQVVTYPQPVYPPA